MRPARYLSRRVSGDSELHTPLRSVYFSLVLVRLSLRRLTNWLADVISFKEALVMGEELDDDAAHNKWLAFGGPFLDVTSKYAMRMR